ncbi:MAG: GNAT family N-acetyltransferase [Verrucomicrobiales bacterium]|nr:GNAT family N-acetyltransferase [Verrucomicrobiales bacterium]
MHRIEPLSAAHDRETFSCGSPPLDLYLRQTAGQHARKGISRTFVLVNETAPTPRPVLGYFTLNLCQAHGEDLPRELARRLPRDVPALKLGRLAVARDRQGQGLGRLLLVAAMEKVVEVHASAGGIGLFVDAKDETARAWYQRFGFTPLPEQPLQLFLPLATIMEALGSTGSTG